MSVEEMARQKALGYNYQQNVADGNLTTAVKGIDGNYRVVGVKTGLISANIKQMKQQAYQKTYEEFYSAIKDMSYDQLSKWFSKNEKYLSERTRHIISDQLRKLRDVERVSSSKSENTVFMEGAGTSLINLGASVGGGGMQLMHQLEEA